MVLFTFAHMREANTEYCTTKEALEMLGYPPNSGNSKVLQVLMRFCGLRRVGKKAGAYSSAMYRVADIQALLEQAAEFYNED